MPDTTYGLIARKAPEKTWPVNIGADKRDMIIAIQAKIKASLGYDVTQRAIVERALAKFHEELFKTLAPQDEADRG